MKLVISIELGNDAMRTPNDVGSLLTHLLAHWKSLYTGTGSGGQFEFRGDDEGPLRDVNGNRVGQWEVLP